MADGLYCTEFTPSFPLTMTLRKGQIRLRPLDSRPEVKGPRPPKSPDSTIGGMGILQKADVLYQSGNFEMALVYYHRGSKLFPKVHEFKDGIKKAQKSSERTGRKMKMTATGDLSIFTHKSPPPKGFSWDKKSTNESPRVKNTTVPSANFRSRQVHPMVKIHKTPSVSLQESRGPSSMNSLLAGSLESLAFEDRLLNPSTEREKLGSLYEDKNYLEFLLGNEAYKNKDTPFGKGTVAVTAEEALTFLQERTHFWDSLGPLPPPHPTKKSQSRPKRGLSRLSHYNSTDSIATCRSGSSWKTNDTVSTHRSRMTGASTYRSRRSTRQEKTTPNPSKIKFDFMSYQRDEDVREMTEIPEEEQEPTHPNHEEEDERTKEEALKIGEETVQYLANEIEEINKAYSNGQIDVCQKKATHCLSIVRSFTEDQIPTKDILNATLHSCLGNCAMHKKNYEVAMEHHQKDLDVGEESGVSSIKSRALGNLGRVHVLMGKYNRALELYNQKAPLCVHPRETAWLFHEIGNCFLMMRIFQYAHESGLKALRASHEADNQRLQLQNAVLVGVAEVNLSKYREAYQHFEEALDLAKILDDKKAQDAMTNALVDVNKKMVVQMKKKRKDNTAQRSKSPRPYNVNTITPVSRATPLSERTNVTVEG